MKNNVPNIKEDDSFFGQFKKFKPIENLHGSAHFAQYTDLVDMSLLGNDGCYVGGFKHGGDILYLQHNGPEHLLTVAPTRSGKGVGIVLPTLLSWRESVVCLDIKGENWALTSGWRKKEAGNICLKFEPTAIRGSVKFNPLAEIPLETEFEVSEAQNIAAMLVDPEGEGLKDHWTRSSFSLLSGVILHCLYEQKINGRTATMADLVTFMSNPESPILEALEYMKTFDHLGTMPHPFVAQTAQEMLNKDPKELSSVVSTAMSFLSLYRDPIVARNTSESEFKISDLMNHDKPVSLFLVIQPRHRLRLKPLIRLLLTQIINGLTNEMEFEDGKSKRSYKHRLLLKLDEFASLGRIPIVEETIAYMAGYGIKASFIVQDLAQLYKYYGEDECISSNCHIQIAYAPNKYSTAEELSKKLGKTTITRKSRTAQRGQGVLSPSHYSEKWEEIERPLMTPDECSRLPGPKKDKEGLVTEAGDMLIFVAGFPAIYGKQILYFKDPVFSARSKISAPLISDIVREAPPQAVASVPEALSSDSNPVVNEEEEYEEGAEESTETLADYNDDSNLGSFAP
jgi:type IV secretion system protein VirD4